MFTLTRLHSYDQEIKKSRFHAQAFPLTREGEIRSLLDAHADADANHNCWAWRLGRAYRFHDDGEPSGTAGKPILQAIDGQALDGVLVIVTRWFGGILLGSGGLMRAYGGTAAQCLRDAPKTEIILRTERSMHVGFSDLALVKARLAGIDNLLIRSETFTETGAEITLAIPDGCVDAALTMIKDITAGRTTVGNEGEA